MKYRMYFFVPYNISEIQKGIQAGHCALEYAYKYADSPAYFMFMENDKTWIILNGGTTRDFKNGVENGGDMNLIPLGLVSNGIDYASFREPDLNYALTAICFLADERVWDYENYPDWEDFFASTGGTMIAYPTLPISFQPPEEAHPETYKIWLDLIGGEKNVFLRNLIKNKRLA